MSRLLAAGILGLLLAVLVWEWSSWRPAALPTPPAASPEGQGQDLAAGLASKLRPLEDRDAYAAILERPIFRPDRRPEPVEEATPSTPSLGEAELAAVDLTAVMITPESVLAWIKRPDQPKLIKLRVGDDLSGWSVHDVLDDRVRLERQGETYELVLRDYSKSPPSAVPAPVSRRQARQPGSAPPPPQNQAPMRRGGRIN